MAKRSFYAAANAISLLGKSGSRVSEDIILQLIRSKCTSALTYGLEAFPLRASDNNSLDFVVNRVFVKLLKISDRYTVGYCRIQFNFDLLTKCSSSET